MILSKKIRFVYCRLQHSNGEYIPVGHLTNNPDNLKELIFFNLNEIVTDDILNSRTRNIGGLFKSKILKKVKSNDFPIFLLEKHLNNSTKRKIF